MLGSLEALNFLPPYLIAPVIFVLWLVVLYLAKRLLFYRLRLWAKATPVWWDDILIESLDFPADFLILASGLALFTNLLPLPEKAEQVATIALQGSVIFAIVFFADRMVHGAIEHGPLPFLGRASQGVTKGLIRGFIIGIGVLIFVDLLGISITPILASLGIGSLAVALALQDTLSNFFAGFYVTVDKPVNVGDLVRLESGDEGTVIDTGWRSTRIRTLTNNIVIIPNSKLISGIITNYYLLDRELVTTVEMSVSPGSDLSKVEAVTVEVAREVLRRVPGAVSGFDPVIRYHSFGDAGIRFTVVLRAKEFNDAALVKHEFIKAIQSRFEKEGIQMPYLKALLLRN